MGFFGRGTPFFKLTTMGILNLIAGDSYWVTNKELARKVGLDAAVLFTDLCQAQKYWNNRYHRQDYFFKTEKELEKDTTLSPYKQREALKILKSWGLIKTSRRGIPAKKYYLIDRECLDNLLCKIFTTGSEETAGLEVEELDNINNNNNSNTNNNKTLDLFKEEDIEEEEPPIKYLEELKEVLELFKELTGMGYRIPTSRSKIKNYGAYKLVSARLRDGASLQDIKNIIIFKCRQWENDDRMQQYRTYHTILLKRNFDKYQTEIQLKNANKNTTTNEQQTNSQKGAGLLNGLEQILRESREEGFI